MFWGAVSTVHIEPQYNMKEKASTATHIITTHITTGQE